ncbi:hypothetical protein HPB51_008592 [Rhipicephalus microplus]|uniref:M13 family peptidase n=1 Tax=Rhipicephalus microplus TaxID=6941 RepID=A0A9J6ENN4_RHIMP|nr:hypothetical protein HPB51_008592 [Rhipicephalus microplus]
MQLILLATLYTWLHLVDSKPAHPGTEAKLINESLNTSVEPCEDFYSYACGGWMQGHEIPATQPSIGTFYLLRNELQINQLTFRLVGRNQLIQPHKNSSKRIIRAYKKLVQCALKIMNANLSHEELDELADTLIHFEGQLANLTTPPEKRRNVLTLYHRTTIDELEKNFTQMPLGYLISKELSEVNITVAGNETIQQFAMDYYRKLDEFLRRANCTTLFNYAGLREVLKWAALASEEFRNASFELTRAVMGVLEEKPRWEECVHTVNSAMPEIVGYLYVLRKFTEEAKREVEDIVKRIAAVFNKTIRESEWMDNDTKAAAESKIPRLYRNASFLEMYHAIQRNNRMRTLMNLRRPFDKDNSLNFGAIGGVVGHEMTHGFDDKGSQFDADGALKRWWTNTTRKKFNEKARCLIYQYGNITDKTTNMTLNGKNTVGENIADNGGVRMAFKAYEALLKKEGEDIRLPGLTHLSGKELFFIAKAMVRSLATFLQGSRYPDSLRPLASIHRHCQLTKWLVHCSAALADWDPPPPSPDADKSSRRVVPRPRTLATMSIFTFIFKFDPYSRLRALLILADVIVNAPYKRTPGEALSSLSKAIRLRPKPPGQFHARRKKKKEDHPAVVSPPVSIGCPISYVILSVIPKHARHWLRCGDVVHLVAAVASNTRASVSSETFHMGMPWTTFEECRQWKRERSRVLRADGAVLARKQAREAECRQPTRNRERECKRGGGSRTLRTTPAISSRCQRLATMPRRSFVSFLSLCRHSVLAL